MFAKVLLIGLGAIAGVNYNPRSPNSILIQMDTLQSTAKGKLAKVLNSVSNQ